MLLRHRALPAGWAEQRNTLAANREGALPGDFLHARERGVLTSGLRRQVLVPGASRRNMVDPWRLSRGSTRDLGIGATVTLAGAVRGIRSRKTACTRLTGAFAAYGSASLRQSRGWRLWAGSARYQLSREACQGTRPSTGAFDVSIRPRRDGTHPRLYRALGKRLALPSPRHARYLQSSVQHNGERQGGWWRSSVLAGRWFVAGTAWGVYSG